MKQFVIYLFYQFMYNTAILHIKGEIIVITLKEIHKELKEMEKLYIKIQLALKDAPAGNLYYQNTGKSTPALPYLETHTDGKRQRQSLKNADLKTIQTLQFKKYAKHLRKIVEQNLSALKHAGKYQPITEDVKSYGGEAFHACREYFFGTEAVNEKFENLPERQNPYKPEQMNIRMKLGAFRSREEYITALAMHNLGLRFKYEAPLAVGMYYRYPDFTVLHPLTGELIFIEVTGLPEDPEYRRSLLKRIDEYANAGVYLGRNLFIIAPSADGGIDEAALIRLLRGIFGI